MRGVWFVALALAACGGSESRNGGSARDAKPVQAADKSSSQTPSAESSDREESTAAGKTGREAEPALTLTSPITQENWRQHPRVVAIRAEVSAIDKGDGPMSFSFADGCGEHGVSKIELAEQEGSVRLFRVTDGGGDITRTTSAYYDASDRPLFAFSQYTHSSAESKYIARAYYTDGKLVFEPRVQQVSERAGPKDDEALPARVPASGKDAGLRFFELNGLCSE